MFIEAESKKVAAGDAIYIPSNPVKEIGWFPKIV